MYVFGPYTLVQAAVAVLTDVGYIVRITNCSIPMNDLQYPIYNIMDVIRMYKGKANAEKEIHLEVVT